MKNQVQTIRSQDQNKEPWEIRFCLGSYLEQLAHSGDKHVQCAAKAGLDSRQNQYH